MKTISNLLIWFLVLILLMGCKKTINESHLPKLSKGTASQITSDSAVLQDEVLSDGGLPISVAGFCLSGDQNPDLNDLVISTSVWGNHFSTTISLNPGTTYYVRAYATNSKGTAYGEQFSFTTKPTLPIVSTSSIKAITPEGLTGGGTVGLEGGPSLSTAHGVCWGTSHNPTISNNKTVDGKGLGSFSSNITGLTPGVTYYLRAYATNPVGTAYGEEISFVKENLSGPTISDVDGNLYHTVTIGTQTWLVENLKTTRFRNGDPIPEVRDSIQWQNLTSSAYCNISNKESNTYTYGRLYNWYAVNDSRKIAPEGWHVPSDAEWTILTDYLKNNGHGYNGDGTKLAKSIASRSGLFVSFSSDLPGSAGNDQASNNSSGFSAVPSGSRVYTIAGLYFSTTMFVELGYTSVWWCSDDLQTPWIRIISHNSAEITRFGSAKRSGFSVRCVKD